jgi:hypothetical protein
VEFGGRQRLKKWSSEATLGMFEEREKKKQIIIPDKKCLRLPVKHLLSL